jgi:hypothetical protein
VEEEAVAVLVVEVARSRAMTIGFAHSAEKIISAVATNNLRIVSVVNLTALLGQTTFVKCENWY